jgi:hypothetical protein
VLWERLLVLLPSNEWRFMLLLLFLWLLLCPGLPHFIEQVHYFLGSLLHNAHEVHFLVLAIDDNFGYPGPEFLVLLARLGKVGDITP